MYLYGCLNIYIYIYIYIYIKYTVYVPYKLWHSDAMTLQWHVVHVLQCLCRPVLSALYSELRILLSCVLSNMLKWSGLHTA